jgi:hypothetical protein
MIGPKFLGGRLSGLNLRFGFKTGRSRRRADRRLHAAAELLRLEDRCMLSKTGADLPPNQVPLDQAANQVRMGTIFWNGGKAINQDAKENPFRNDDIPAPDATGAEKTITFTNYGTTTIYPFLRTENTGKDPGSTGKNQYYDPEDLHGHEFREYVGYSVPDGNKTDYFLGLPAGASITVEVPLVLWDGDNVSIVTDDTYLTTPPKQLGATVFGYQPDAKISILGTAKQNNAVWLKSSASYPSGDTPFVMFYYADTASTVTDDAPAQLAELTFRDTYLKHFIVDRTQTFALMNYDVSSVNKLSAPVAMEANNVPITAGAVDSHNLQYFPPNEAFGWHGSQKTATQFDSPILDFVNNDNPNDAYLGTYFGGKGWPAFYNPANSKTNLPSGIPSGANIFDLSPLDIKGRITHVSNYDSDQWMLTSSGGGAISASAAGNPVSVPKPTTIGLNFSNQTQRDTFASNILSMQASGEAVSFSVSTDKPLGVFGSFVSYNNSSSVRAYNVTSKGSGYSPDTQLVISGGGGSGAKGTINFGKNGSIDSIGFLPDWGGSGYTSAPTVTFDDPTGKGQGATATADITGGTVTLKFNKALPPEALNRGLGLDFNRTATDYAATRITDLWYSWAHYYVEQISSNYKDNQKFQGTTVYGSIGDKLNLLTNQITLPAGSTSSLAVGMGVTAPDGIPKGTTILSISGNTVNLSQIPQFKPDPSNPKSQLYTFTLPTDLPIDATSQKYTTPYELTFGAADTQIATLFGGSVYEAMQTQLVGLTPPVDTTNLPNTMRVVDDVIKFNAVLPTHESSYGTALVGQIRDVTKSILRGVYNYYAVPDQTEWYPNPAAATGGQTFNVYNLDPYVWFAHTQEGLSGYAFSVDDDVANPSATGPDGDDNNHYPNNLQIAYSGIQNTSLPNTPPLANLNEWFPTTKWGQIQTTATIGVLPFNVPKYKMYAGYSYITLTGDDPLRTLNKIITPGPGQVGAYIFAPGYIVPGTTLIYFPDGVLDSKNPTIVLSQPAVSTTTSIPITINAAQFKLPTVPVINASFANPAQTSAPYYTNNPTGPNVGWTFTGTSGIAAGPSDYTKNNTLPIGETQVAFIQDQGSISQSVSLVPGQAYAVSFLVDERKLDNGTFNNQPLQVSLGNQVIGTFTPSATTDGTFTLFTSNAFTVPSAGAYAITIAGQSPNGGNNMALVGSVIVTGGPITP